MTTQPEVLRAPRSICTNIGTDPHMARHRSRTPLIRGGRGTETVRSRQRDTWENPRIKRWAPNRSDTVTQLTGVLVLDASGFGPCVAGQTTLEAAAVRTTQLIS